MLEPTRQETLVLTEIIRERSHALQEKTVNRTVEVLAAKRARFREELQDLILHLGLLVPIAGNLSAKNEHHSHLLQEAVNRLGDEAFAQFLLQIIKDMG